VKGSENRLLGLNVKNTYLIGLTGNLGSGKSTIRKMLEGLGARGIDADALAHLVMARGTPVWRAIIEAFGPDIMMYNGGIDRHLLSERVFADAGDLAKLEAIVHPAVGERIRQEIRDELAPVVVIEAIKLIEAGLRERCDAVWVVQCAPAVQLERVMRDRHMSEVAARARLAAQTPLADKLIYADVVIDNSRDQAATQSEVEAAWHSIHPETGQDKSTWLHVLASDKRPRIVETAASQPVLQPTLKPSAQTEAPPPAPVWVTFKPSAATQEITVDQNPSETPAPQSPAWATADVEVRRARRSDIDALSVAFARFENRHKPLSRGETIQRLGERGYFIVLSEKRIVALASWEAENLVAIVPDIWAESPDTAPLVLPRLFALIEDEARQLLCEVVLLLIDQSALTLAAGASAVGYAQCELLTLHSVWQSVARERIRGGHLIWLKPLREGVTNNPS
jgi:dephospho-CoA kinase